MYVVCIKWEFFWVDGNVIKYIPSVKITTNTFHSVFELVAKCIDVGDKRQQLANNFIFFTYTQHIKCLYNMKIKYYKVNGVIICIQHPPIQFVCIRIKEAINLPWRWSRRK